MKKQYLKAKIVVQKDDKKITVIASDETLDRHGDVLPIENWDLTKFLTAPRMMIDHNHRVESIVGKWENVRIEGKKLLMDANFHDFTPIATAVRKMVEEGYLNTVSVGFIWNGPDKDGGTPSFELIETSWVTVPANPSARVQSSFKSLLDKGITEEEKKNVIGFAGEIKEEDPEDLDDKDPEEDDEPELDEEGNPILKPADDDEVLDDTIETSLKDIEDRTPEAFEKAGYVFIESLEDFNKSLEKDDKDIVRIVSLNLLTKLFADSEQLQTLTDKGLEVLRAEKVSEMVRVSLKEAAGIISHALREANKSRAN